MNVPSTTVPTIAALILTGCFPVDQPTPRAPSFRAPAIELPTDPPMPGMGRVVIETDADPATAALILSQGLYVGYRQTLAGVSTRRLCTTPCAVDLPLGEHEVWLHVEGSALQGKIVVRAETRPAVVLVRLGEAGRSTRTGLGGMLLLVGSAGLLPVALLEGGPATTGLSVAGIVAGGALMYLGRPTYRQTSYAQYTIGP